MLLCGIRYAQLRHCSHTLFSISSSSKSVKGSRCISHKPLRILFCGSDKFSIASLKAVNRLRLNEPERIGSINVICRPDKHIGRGLTEIKSAAIKGTTHELGLQLEEVESFKLWKVKPDAYDLIITVSFGLLVPEAVLTSAKYGGLNVHPSLLPNFRGAAPIQHTLLKRMHTTGVSLQTMHGTKFDYGTVLSQREYPLTNEKGLVPFTTLELLDELCPVGADLLVTGIKDELFIDPKPLEDSPVPDQLYMAPKINKTNRRIDWDTWTADDILLKDRVLSDLWDTVVLPRTYQDTQRKQQNRMVYHGPWSYVEVEESDEVFEPGRPVLIEGRERQKDYTVAIPTVDGKLIRPMHATIEGKDRNKGLGTVRGVAQKMTGTTICKPRTV